MTLYTKTGDAGLTTSLTGRRVLKDDLLMHASGSLDELNCHVGLSLAAVGAAKYKPVKQALKPIQRELFSLGAMLVGAGGSSLSDTAVKRMEQQIDAIWAELGQLHSFLLPGGCEPACRLHVARTVCRRAERGVVTLIGAQAPAPPVVLRYLNRLSDLLFALARQANAIAGESDDPLSPGGRT